MKTFSLIIISFFCFSFFPSTKNSIVSNSNGFYITVKDLTDRSYHSFIVEEKDSVDFIFNKYFKGELDLGELDYPISIYNGKRDFYVARVNVFLKSNGKKGFKNLKYPKVYDKSTRKKGRSQVEDAIFERATIKKSNE
ncbi:MAG: hypothetical protein Q8S54_08520 [Bacteroidota bacterium]|nr:hypothetical protein [Odoribacter sp.]MDP3643217.1 hypothetical protein [Bacteroidota bacterium]